MTIPGITYIGIAEARKLQPDVALRALSAGSLSALVKFDKIEFCGQPEATIEKVADNDKAGTLEKVTLTFRTEKRLKEGFHPAFLIRTAQGREYLIGSAEAPWVKVAMKGFTGNPGGEAAVYTYEVTHTAIRTMIPSN